MKFLTTFIIGLLCTVAFAEEAKTIKVEIPCNEARFIEFNLTHEYNEIGLAEGTGAFMLPDGNGVTGTVTTYINPESRSFTILLKTGDDETDLACILFAGDDFVPVRKVHNKEEIHM